MMRGVFYGCRLELTGYSYYFGRMHTYVKNYPVARTQPPRNARNRATPRLKGDRREYRNQVR